MLKIRTRVGPSSIHGLGLFAAEPAPRGTEIWRFTPGFDLEADPALLDTLPALARETLLHYGYIERDLGRYILCCDDARFINYSPNPNIASVFDGDPYGVDIALRDIAAGEEITIDYARFEPPPQPNDPG